MRVVLIAKPGHVYTGVGRYVRMLQQELPQRELEVLRIEPVLPPLPSAGYNGLRRLGIDLRAFLLNYPVWARYPEADVYHFTSQNLASLLLLHRPRGRVVVTVHDIIPYMLRNDAKLSTYRSTAECIFDRLAIAGLRRADRLIADSHYTKQCLIDHLGIQPTCIDVVHLGVDCHHFRPMPLPDNIQKQYGLAAGRRYIITVGSDDPRKNLSTLVHALAQIRVARPDVELLKVGRPHFEHERQRLVRLADQLGVSNAIHFLDDVLEHDLPVLYNLADVCAMPSLYEGFGFPVLEAMASGTPVVCAQAASLPELVGDAASMFSSGPGGATRLAHSILGLLGDQLARDALRTEGLKRAATFTWSACAENVWSAYRNTAISSRVAA